MNISKLSSLVIAAVFAALGAGVAVGVLLWEPWADEGNGERSQPLPTPTADEPRLTAEEAIGLVSGDCPDATTGALIGQNAAASYKGNSKWEVRYVISGSTLARWTVDESNNSVIPLGQNMVAYACRTEPPSMSP